MQRSEGTVGVARRAEQPLRRPPRWLMRAMNVVPNVLLRSPLHGLIGEKVLLLGFAGRRSGRRYTTPMSYARVGDEILMSTEAPWWRNLADGATVTLRLRGEDVEAFAQATSDERRCVEGLHRLVEHYPGYSRFLGVGVDGNGRPDEGDILKAARRGRVFISARVAQGWGEAGH